MICKQILCSQDNKKVVTWVPDPERIKEGYMIELKGKDGLWFVDAIYDIAVDKKEINHSWKVGGL